MSDEKKSLGERVAEWSRSPEGIAAMMRDEGVIISVGGVFFTTDITTVTASVETNQSIKVEPAVCVTVTPEFLAAADVEADTPITIRPPVESMTPEEVMAELVRENQEWGMYDNPPGPRTGEK